MFRLLHRRLFIACFAFAELALAQPEPEPSPVAREYAPPGPRDPSQYNHDGFFLRMGLGVGPAWLSETVRVPEQPALENDFSGPTLNTEFWLGGTLGSGFVLGAGLTTQTMLFPTDEITALQLGTFALFAAMYPDPRSGLSVQALLGYGQLRLIVDEREQDNGDVTGLVLGAGVGYDFWVGKQWSLGPAARLTYATLGDEQDGVELDATWLCPSLSFVATYH